jgi:DNA repair exonuclease SbcCD nuclease subunit
MDKKIFDRFDRVFTGHYHTRSDDGKIFYLGNPYQLYWSDYNDKRGFTIFDTETNEIIRINNPYEIFKIIYYYDNAFANHSKIKTPARSKNSSHVFHQYTLQLIGIDRNKLREQLNEKGIPSMVYYPIPLHLQKAFASNRYKEGDFPVTEKLCESVLSLPMHTELDEETLKYICNTLLELIK